MLRNLFRRVPRADAHSQDGPGPVEYAIVIALIVLLVLFILWLLGPAHVFPNYSNFQPNL
jgi:hypothetical protein